MVTRLAKIVTGITVTFLSLPLAALASTWYTDPYIHYYTTPTCSIQITNYNPGQNGYDKSITLSWSSTNAERVSISGIGSVAPNGAMVVNHPKIASFYEMTVSNSATSVRCSTNGYPYSYQNPNQYPYVNQYQQVIPQYVNLTQIPYTGFDLGTFGTMLYSTILLGFVLALSYLAFYFRSEVVRNR